MHTQQIRCDRCGEIITDGNKPSQQPFINSNNSKGCIIIGSLLLTVSAEVKQIKPRRVRVPNKEGLKQVRYKNIEQLEAVEADICGACVEFMLHRTLATDKEVEEFYESTDDKITDEEYEDEE